MSGGMIEKSHGGLKVMNNEKVRYAISTDGNLVSGHFGRCPSFTLLDVEKGEVIQQVRVDNPGHEPGFIPKFLHEKEVNCIIAGGMGMRAQMLFEQYGISAVLGVQGTIEEVIHTIQNGVLEGGDSLCKPGAGKGYGLDKTECTHGDESRQDCEKE